MICLFSSIIIITWNIRAVEHINSYFKLLILFDYALRIWRFTVGFNICILCIVCTLIHIRLASWLMKMPVSVVCVCGRKQANHKILLERISWKRTLMYFFVDFKFACFRWNGRPMTSRFVAFEKIQRLIENSKSIWVQWNKEHKKICFKLEVTFYRWLYQFGRFDIVVALW